MIMIVIMIFLVKVNNVNSILNQNNTNNSNGSSHSLNESSNKFILIINILNLTLHQPTSNKRWYCFEYLVDSCFDIFFEMANCCIFYFPLTIG